MEKTHVPNIFFELGEDHVLRVYRLAELVVEQPVNPETGKPFQSKDEARKFAESIAEEISIVPEVFTREHLATLEKDFRVKFPKLVNDVEISVPLKEEEQEESNVEAPSQPSVSVKKATLARKTIEALRRSLSFKQY